MSDDPMELIKNMTSEERATLAAQFAVVAAGGAFVSALADGDLAAAWPMMHPDMRLVWVQSWQYSNREALESDGYNLPEMAEIMSAATGPEYLLWGQFAGVAMRDLARLGIEEGFGFGSFPRLVGPDLELLHIHRGAGIVHPGESAVVVQLLMAFDGQRWLALALGGEAPSVPGYPPTL